jgi:hypothetical protein
LGFGAEARPMTNAVGFHRSNPESSLLALARSCDHTPLDPDQIPPKFLDYYGIEILSNSLNLAFPQLPTFDEQRAISFISSKSFKTLDSVIQAISTRGSEIDKLFCAFHYVTHHIQYSCHHACQSAEGVFGCGRASADGYSILVRTIATRSGIESYEIERYSNQSKGWRWNDSNPPIFPKADHVCLVVVIEGHPWLCDPTWAAGTVDSEGNFQFQFNRNWFLRPLICTLNDHFPMEGSERFLGSVFRYKRFVRCPSYWPTEHEFRNESHPFGCFSCEGLLELHFGVKHSDQQVSGQIPGLECDMFTVEIVERLGSRDRWVLRAAFPTVSIYRIYLCVGETFLTELLVDNRRRNSRIPFVPCRKGDSVFVPITPGEGLVNVREGFALIRFGLSTKRSFLSISVRNIENEEFVDLVGRERLMISGDRSHYEHVVTVSFPSVGRWTVIIFARNEVGVSEWMVTYRFDVLRIIRNFVSPLNCIPRDRHFLSLKVPEQMRIIPRESTIFIDSFTFEFETTFVGRITVSSRDDPGNKSIVPLLVSGPRADDDDAGTATYRVCVPSAGVYEVRFCFGRRVIEQVYAVCIPRVDVAWGEGHRSHRPDQT